MMKLRRCTLASIVLTIGLLVGCASDGPRDRNAPVSRLVPGTYQVRPGDNLIRIAFQYDLDHRDIARWNRLASPDRILVGQVLRLRPPADGELPPPSSTPAPPSPPPLPSTKPDTPANGGEQQVAVVAEPSSSQRVNGLDWRWPTSGQVVQGYAPSIPGRKGVQIQGSAGQNVVAASPGQVVYSGSGLPGYGRLIIVRHSDTFLSAYGYLGDIFVREGERVSSGQNIAEMGTSSDNRPVLHFEIRQNGKPVDPLSFLPS